MDPEHERRLRAFQSGKPKMTVAVNTTSGEVVFFPTRDASSTTEAQDAYRDMVRRNFRCIVPDCPTSELTAVFLKEGTDHFRHLKTDRQHDPESLLHHMGKRVLAHWAAQQPGWSAAIEQTAPDGTCRPDVTLTSPDGRRQVLEVQYSTLKQDKFVDRNDRHLANEFTARTWFLGSRTRYYRYRTDGRLRIHRLGRQILDSGGVLLWLNPQTREVVTAYDKGPTHPAGELADARTVVPLDECTLDPVHGVLTPKLIEILATARAREAAAARERAREEERRQLVQTQQQRRQRHWEDSEERTWILRRHDGDLPPVISSASVTDQMLADRFSVLPVHLKARIYMVIATSDKQMTRGQVHRAIPRSGGRVVKFDPGDFGLLQRFLNALARERLIELDAQARPPIVGPVGMTLVRPREPVEPPDPPAEPDTLRTPRVVQIVAGPLLPPPPPPSEEDLRVAAARVLNPRTALEPPRRGLVARLRHWWRRP